MNLNYEISVDDPVIIYRLRGKIVSDEDYTELEREVFDYLNQNYYRIIFDLGQLTHINSSGIVFFMRTLTKSRIMNGDLVLISITGNVKKVFEIAKLNEVYTIYENEPEGINHFKTTK